MAGRGGGAHSQVSERPASAPMSAVRLETPTIVSQLGHIDLPHRQLVRTERRRSTQLSTACETTSDTARSQPKGRGAHISTTDPPSASHITPPHPRWKLVQGESQPAPHGSLPVAAQLSSPAPLPLSLKASRSALCCHENVHDWSRSEHSQQARSSAPTVDGAEEI